MSILGSVTDIVTGAVANATGGTGGNSAPVSPVEPPAQVNKEPANPEMDANVKSAFEQAAKALGMSIGFNGRYVYLNEECTAEEKSQIEEKKANVAANCEATPPMNTDGSATPAIGAGNPEEIKDKPKLSDSVPGTPWTYRDAFGSLECGTEKNFESATKEQITNITYAMQQLKKLSDALGWTGFKINSAVRSPWCNSKIGGSPTSSHMKGYALDITFAKSQNLNKFLQLISLYNRGGLGGNQFIFEFNAGTSHSASSIIHLDFNPSKSGKNGPMAQNKIGGQNFSSIEVRSEDDIRAFLRKQGSL